MAELYPTFDVPVMVEQAQETQNMNKYSANFDFETGDFTQNKAGKIQEAEPYDAWVQWCMKSVYTERYNFFAYSSNEGAEMEQAMKEPTRAARESAIERTVTETLLADPYKRTVYVRDFEFMWAGDSVKVSFIVGGVWEKEEKLIVSL